MVENTRALTVCTGGGRGWAQEGYPTWQMVRAALREDFAEQVSARSQVLFKEQRRKEEVQAGERGLQHQAL